MMKRRRTDDDYEEIHGYPRPERIGGESVEWVKLRAQIAHLCPGIGDPWDLCIEEFFQVSGQLPEVMKLLVP